MDAKIEKIWTVDEPHSKWLRVNWDNGRRTAVEIRYPFGPKETLIAIEMLWHTIKSEYQSGKLEKEKE